MRIVILHSEGYEPWLNDLLNSLHNCWYPVDVVDSPGWVTDGLRYISEHDMPEHQGDSVFLLNETMVIKDHSLFDKAAAIDGPAALSPGYLMFCGKFVPEQLSRVKWPVVKDKRADVIYGEAGVCRDQLAPGVPVLCPDFTDPDYNDEANYQERHGRRNLVLKNDYLIKFKGTWTL